MSKVSDSIKKGMEDIKAGKATSWEEMKKDWKLKEKWNKEHPVLYFLDDLPWKFYRAWHNHIKRWPKELKWFIQRGKRGWADCDTWCFSFYHSRVCKEALSHLKKYKMGYPCYFDESGYTDEDNSKKWDATLSHIIHSFKTAEQLETLDIYMYSEHAPDMTEFCEKNKIKYQTKEEYDYMIEGFRLFFKHYWSLWD